MIFPQQGLCIQKIHPLFAGNSLLFTYPVSQSKRLKYALYGNRSPNESIRMIAVYFLRPNNTSADRRMDSVVCPTSNCGSATLSCCIAMAERAIIIGAR